MKHKRYIGRYPQDLASGRVLAFGDVVTESDLNLEDPHDARFLNDGLLIEHIADSGDFDSGATIPVVLGWVGDDKQRAEHALETERARGDKARPKLIEQLEQLVNAEGGDDNNAEEAHE